MKLLRVQLACELRVLARNVEQLLLILGIPVLLLAFFASGLALALAAALRALISPKARLYSLGNTLTNFKRACAQLSNNSRARWLPVHLWWSSSNLRN